MYLFAYMFYAKPQQMGVNNMHAINFTDARKHFAETMKRVTDDAEPVRVMRRDAPDIVMIDAGEYEALIETVYLFSNPRQTGMKKPSISRHGLSAYMAHRQPPNGPASPARCKKRNKRRPEARKR